MTEQEKSEKAIEEMAEMVEVFTHGVCSTRQGVIDALERGGYSDIKNLYEAGYRKVPKDAIILTKKQQIKDIKAQTVAIDNARYVARKETAKDVFDRVDEIIGWCITNENGEDFDYEYFSNCLRNLKKEFCVLENNYEKLVNKKVKVTFFDNKIKIGVLKRANYYELGGKNHFVVDGQPFYAEYVNNIEEVEK